MIDLTEAESGGTVTEYTPEPTWSETASASFDNFRSVNMSNSRNNNWKEEIGLRTKNYIESDPDNEGLYTRMSGYDTRDLSRLQVLQEEGKLDTYTQVNPFNMDLFLLEDFKKFQSLRPEELKSIGQTSNDKALKTYTSTRQTLEDSEHWTAEMVGTLGGALTDPATLQTLPLGSWKAGGTVLSNAGRAIVEEMGIEALAQTTIATEVYSYKKELGIKTSILQEATTAATSIVGAGLFRGAGSATFDLTAKGISKLKAKDPELGAEYEAMAKSQVTDNMDEHSINLQKTEFDEAVTEVTNPDVKGLELNNAKPIMEDDIIQVQAAKDAPPVKYDENEFKILSGEDAEGQAVYKSHKELQDEIDLEKAYIDKAKECAL